MRFSIATFVWTPSFDDAHLGIVDTVAEIGYDGLEIAFDGSGGPDPARLRERLEATGLSASVLAFCAPDRNISSADPASRAAGHEYLAGAIEFAAAVGAETVAGPLAHPPGQARPLPATERADERSRAIESLRILGDVAAAAGVRLGVEQLSRFDSDMFNTAEQSIELAGEIDRPAVGLLLDTFHMQLEERSPGDAIRAVGDRLVHFHAVESHRGELGTGQIAWDDVFAGLVDIGYEHMVSIETFGPSGTPLDALVNMWRPWFDDPATFARNSLAFCRARLDLAQGVAR